MEKMMTTHKNMEEKDGQKSRDNFKEGDIPENCSKIKREKGAGKHVIGRVADDDTFDITNQIEQMIACFADKQKGSFDKEVFSPKVDLTFNEIDEFCFSREEDGDDNIYIQGLDIFRKTVTVVKESRMSGVENSPILFEEYTYVYEENIQNKIGNAKIGRRNGKLSPMSENEMEMKSEDN